MKHTHPKRFTQISEADYGDVVEKTVLTSLEKPIETIYQKNKEINPEKISFGYLGTLEVFSYVHDSQFFFIGAKDSCVRVPIDCSKNLIRLYSKITDYYGLRNHKRFKK